MAFHVHTSGAAGDADGSVEVGFASAGSCTSGQPSGPRTYDVTSKAVRHVDQDPSGAGVDWVVVTFANLNVTDETTPGEGGAIVVECSNFTLRVTVVEAGTGPRSAQVEFQILDGAGKLWWSSGGLQPLSTGSLAIG